MIRPILSNLRHQEVPEARLGHYLALGITYAESPIWETVAYILKDLRGTSPEAASQLLPGEAC